MEQQAFEAEALKLDLEDLSALLMMRFGSIPDDVWQTLTAIKKPDVLQRLILVAANVPDWAKFMKELEAGEESFRLVGEDFNPLSEPNGGQAR